MNRRLLTILLIAFFIATACTLLIAHLIRNQAASRQPATTPVVAANADIKLGTVLTADNLMTLGVVGPPPQGAILVKDMKSVIGRGVISDLYKGEPIMESRLAAPGAGGGLAPAIPTGMRACAVKVDEVVGVSGFATPGMRVDVVISGIPPGEQGNGAQGTVAKTVLQNIKVLSAGTDFQQVKDDQGKAKQVQVVNLLVTPQQAETLELASSETIRLVLRNPLDTTIVSVPGTALGNLFSGANGAPAQPKRVVAVKRVAPKAFVVEVLNGSKQTSEKFASPGGRQ